MDDELLDLVDEHDQVIGQVWRSEWVTAPGKIRAVNAFIQNDKGQLWIPRRTATKKLLPLALDMSVSGCVASGEDYDTAFAREAQEEINLDITSVPYECMGYLNPYKDEVKFFMKVYRIYQNDTPNYNHDDFCEYYWLTPQEVVDRLKAGDASKPGLPVLLRMFYDV
ncbi:MAG: NUDIX domain-containing protein [Candidatus Babeliales bacterium]